MASYLTNNEAIPRSNTEILRTLERGTSTISTSTITEAIEPVTTAVEAIADSQYISNWQVGWYNSTSLGTINVNPIPISSVKYDSPTLTIAPEKHIYNGASIQGGSATKYFSIWKVSLLSLDAGSRPSCFYIYSGDASEAITASVDVSTNKITPPEGTRLPSSGARVMFTSLSTVTGLTTNIIYYVYNSDATSFDVCAYDGTSPIDLTGTNGNVVYKLISDYTFVTSFVLTSTVLTASLGHNEAIITCPKIPCNKNLWIYGLHNGAAATVSYGVYFNVHLF